MLTKQERKTLKDSHLYKGLCRNTTVPKEKDELLNNLKRLSKYFQESESLQKEYIDALNPSHKSSENGYLLLILGFILIGWILSIVTDFLSGRFMKAFESLFILIVIGLFYEYVFTYSSKQKRCERQFRNLYKKAENNFVLPEHVDALSNVYERIASDDGFTYEEAVEYVIQL